MMNRLLATLLAGAAVLGTASVAHASIMTTATQTITFNNQLTDWSQAGSFNLFNSSLGSLISVNITASAAETSTVTVSNQGALSTGTANTKVQLTLDSSNSSIQAVLNSLSSTSPAANPNDFYLLSITGQDFNFRNLGNNQTVSGASSGSANTNITDTVSSDLNAFTGSGSANLTGLTFTNTIISSTGGNASASQVTNGSGAFNISYTYNAPDAPPPTGVPEPASMALLGAGLLGAGLVRRRK